jgi:uncharacterized repeat protein (TIGR01451 family)
MVITGQTAGTEGSLRPTLATARISSGAVDDILVLDPGNIRLHILDHDSGGAASAGFGVAWATTSLEAASSPVAVLPMRLNGDAQSDLVLLEAGHKEPVVALTTPQATFTVTSNADSGAGSLRDALLTAAGSKVPNFINFNIPGSGTPTIRPATQLPIQSGNIMIDGSTQPGGRVEIDGSLATRGAPSGIVLTGGNSTVRGLVINRFSGSGIIISTGGNDFIEGNLIGTDVTGQIDLGNLSDAITIDGSSKNTIGGTTAASRNVLVHNNPAFSFGQAGVRIVTGVNGAIPTGNLIQGNFIGTDITGAKLLGIANGIASSAVLIDGGQNNTVGGISAGAGNVLTSGASHAILIGTLLGVGLTSGNLVQGNFIGTDVSGTHSLGGSFGVTIDGGAQNTIGGTAKGAGNMVAGCTAWGISIRHLQSSQFSSANFIQGNVIGSSGQPGAAVTGAGWLSPQATGDASLTITGLPASVAAGTRLSYDVTLRNAGPDPLADPLVFVPLPLGTTFHADAISQGFARGTGPGTTGALTYMPGPVPAGGSATITVSLNVLAPPGSTLTATATVSNAESDPTPSDNSVSGTTLVQGGGIVSLSWQQTPSTSSNPVPPPTGLQAVPAAATGFTLGNGAQGVVISSSSDNAIGGTTPGAGNVISNNGGAGVLITSGMRNSILSNSISQNGELGIDLGNGTGPDGVTPNHPFVAGIDQTGANFLQNYPVLAGASQSAVSGFLDSTPNSNYRLEFFANSACDPSAHGQGLSFIGFANVATDGRGHVGFSFSTLPKLKKGVVVTATATDASGNTSEFSGCVIVGQPMADLTVSRLRLPGSAVQDGTEAYLITVMNAGPEAASNLTLNEWLPGDAMFLRASGPSAGSISIPAIGGRDPIALTTPLLAAGESISLEYAIARDAGTVASDATAPEHGALSSPSELRTNSITPASAPCTVSGFNIYKSDSSPVATTPDNLWKTVPAGTQNTDMPAAPAGSFYVVTTLWDCSGTIVESNGSNQAGIPAGPTLTKLIVTGKIKITGTGFTTSIQVFVDGIGFVKHPRINGSTVIQKGRLTNGNTIAGTVTTGKTVNVSVQNSDGGLSSLLYTGH